MAAPEASSSRTDGEDKSAPSRGRVIKVLAGVVGIGLVAVAVLWGGRDPRSSEVSVEAPMVCSYPRPDGFDRVALVSCSSDGVVGVVNRSQTLISAGWNLGSYSDAEVAYIHTDSEHGTLRINKPWFGSESYVFVAADGTETELKETRHYIGGVVESLGSS